MGFKKITFTLLFLALNAMAYAQDKIYLWNGDMINGKIVEVGIKNITYKRADNADGPNYAIPKREVDHIVYENGTEDRFASELEPRLSFDGPQGEHQKHSETNKLKYGNNILAIAPLQLTADNVQSGVGFSVSYERVLDKSGIISLYLPVIVSFNNNNNNNNYGYYGSAYTNSSNTNYSTVYFMPGIKFYPTGNRGLIRYAVGPSFVFASGQQPYDYIDPTGNYMYQATGNYNIFGVMINNSMNVYPTPHLYLGLELGLGASYIANGSVYNDTYNQQGPMVQFSFKIGYRF